MTARSQFVTITRMKAVVYDTYGLPEVLQVKDIPKPKLKDNELLVRVENVAVTVADSRIRGARFPKGFAPFARLAFGVFRPRKKVLGSCFSGVVAAVGSSVDNFAIGDEVCGTSGAKMGAYAEYVAVSAHKPIVKKPKGVSHKDAAGVLFGGTAALYFLRDRAKVFKGQNLLINGASGAVGTNGVQLARHFGASVTAVTSAANADLVKSLGAHKVVDYEKQNLTMLSQKYDVVLDTVGNIPIKAGKKLLTKDGKLLLMVASLPQMFQSSSQVLTGVAPEKVDDMAFLLSLVGRGELKVVIDKVYAIEDIVEAHRHVEKRNKKGNVVLSIT